MYLLLALWSCVTVSSALEKSNPTLLASQAIVIRPLAKACSNSLGHWSHHSTIQHAPSFDRPQSWANSSHHSALQHEALSGIWHPALSLTRCALQTANPSTLDSRPPTLGYSRAVAESHQCQHGWICQTYIQVTRAEAQTGWL